MKETHQQWMRRASQLTGMRYEDIPVGEEGDAVLPILGRWDHPCAWKYTEYIVMGQVGPIKCRVYQK